MSAASPSPRRGFNTQQALSVLLFSSLLTAMSLLFFAGGYLFGNMDGRTGGPLSRSGLLPGPPSPATLTDAQRIQYGVLFEALGEIERSYYKRDALSDEMLARGAVKGLVEAVGDPYTLYLTPHAREMSDEELRGSFDGIGVQVDLLEGHLRVVAPLPGSPAERAGLKPGDLITQVDGKDIGVLQQVSDAVALIRGPRGSSVNLTVIRAGTSQTEQISVERGEVRVQSVTSKQLTTPGLSYLKINTFAEPTARQVRDQLKTILESKPTGLVIDLRRNPGGLLSSAVDITSQFMRDGVVLYQDRGGDTERREYRVTGSPQAPDVPIAVLVDGGSASAAEIMAAALRENNRAVLVGEKTYGKGTVQEIHNLSDQSQLRVTVAQWLTPNGIPIQGQGIVPDMTVAPVAGTDAPLEAAMQYLTTHMQTARG